MTVLFITHSRDNASVDRVEAALERRGLQVARLNTDLFPTEVALEARLGASARSLRFEPRDGASQRVDLATVSAVWYRRFYPGRGIPDDLEPQIRRASVEESRRTLLSTLQEIDAFWLDPYPRVRAASHKLGQLRVARDLGMNVPETLMTNDPAAVRRFAATCPGGVVTKMLSSFAIYDEAGEEQVVFTTPLSGKDLEELEGLNLCPMTFQERVVKERELRVTVVGRRVFCAAVDSQLAAATREDWRRDGLSLEGRWHEHALPKPLEEQILALCRHYGLNYGAIDLILTPEGRYVFLEINPVGEFFWLELSEPHLPLSEALAEVLADPRARG